MKKKVFAVVVIIVVTICCVAIAENLYSTFVQSYKELDTNTLLDMDSLIRAELIERETGWKGQKVNIIPGGFYEAGDVFPVGQYRFIVKSIPSNSDIIYSAFIFDKEYQGNKGTWIHPEDVGMEFSLFLGKDETLSLPEGCEFYVMRDEIAF